MIRNDALLLLISPPSTNHTMSSWEWERRKIFVLSFSPPHTLIFANMKLFLPLFSHLAEEKKTKKEEKVSPSFRPLLLLLFFLLNMRAYITGARRRRRRWRKKGEKGEKLFLPPPHFSFSSASLLLHLNAFVFSHEGKCCTSAQYFWDTGLFSSISPASIR